MPRPKPKIFKHLPGTREQYDFVGQLTESEKERTLLTHVLASTRMNDDGTMEPVPLPTKSFLRPHGLQGAAKSLVEKGCFRLTPKDQRRRKCRCAVVDDALYRRFLEAGPSALEGAVLVNLRTGKPTRARVKTILTPRNRNPYPALVRAAMVAIAAVLVNLAAVRVHLGQLERDVVLATTREERVYSLARLNNDRRCLSAIVAQNARKTESGLWVYDPAFKPQRTGRITQIGGGAQSCSRAMKHALYDGVPGVRNLDLASSQARILLVEMEEAQIDCAWLKAYVETPGSKERSARVLGLSEGDWKSMLYAVQMGARVPSAGQLPFSEGRIAVTLRRAFGEAGAADALARFNEHIADLRRAMAEWHDYLANERVVREGVRSPKDGKVYVRNRSEMTLCVTDLERETEYKMRSALAAFYLQGREACFINSLIAQSVDHGYKVLSHEHDGMVLQGRIPDACLATARRASGLPAWASELVEKPL